MGIERWGVRPVPLLSESNLRIAFVHIAQLGLRGWRPVPRQAERMGLVPGFCDRKASWVWWA